MQSTHGWKPWVPSSSPVAAYGNMFNRRDIPPVLLLLLLIILVMLTLSQILVVHNGRYGKNIHSMRKLQMELREMDMSLQSLMYKSVPSIDLNRKLLQNEINAGKIAAIIAQASSKAKKQQQQKQQSGLLAKPNSSIEIQETLNSLLVEPLGTGKEEEEEKYEVLSFSSSSSSSLKDTNTNHTAGLNDSSSSSQLAQNINRTSLQRRFPHPHSLSSRKRTTSRHHVKLAKTRNVTRHLLLDFCPSIPPGLTGRVFLNFSHSHNYTWKEIRQQNPHVLPGGTWKPTNCVARHRVAIIIPYRDREQHLATLLSHLHPILHRQQLHYRIFVVEQEGKNTFNKAEIMNIAFVEALKLFPYQCFVFHDVDLVPEDDRNMYSCPVQPRHMSVAIDEMGYKLAYQELVGGVLNLRTEHFQRVNGYSNMYWGWGAEDDDMAYRIMHVGLKITRPPESVARYKMIKHTKRKPSDWRKRAKLLYTGTRRFQVDGLNSLKYKVVFIRDLPLYTHVMVDIGKPPKGF